MTEQPHRPFDLAALFKTWRRDPGQVLPCPACGQPLTVIDKSARPYAEWYNFRCTACSFDQSIHIPLAGPSSY